MKILITGSTGFIGSNLVKYYSTSSALVFPHTRQHSLSEMLEVVQPDVIINTAAEIYNPESMWSTNVEMTRSCLEYCKNVGATLMHLGSSSEYGPVDRSSCETDAVHALDMYSGTKSIATLMCKSYAATYNTDVVIIRPYSPYGPGERPHRLFPALWRSFKLGHSVKLVNGVHDFCYIDDFVRAVDIILTSDLRTPGEIINVSSGQQTTNLEVLEIFQKVTGLAGNITIDDRFVTPPVWCADISHLTKKYNWRPEFTLEQGIKKFLEVAHYE